VNEKGQSGSATRPGSLHPAGSAASLDQAKNLCSWAAATLESALLGARKGEIEWALTKSETAVKTLKRAKKLMPPNTEVSEAGPRENETTSGVDRPSLH
jgi:hypothetical protein